MSVPLALAAPAALAGLAYLDARTGFSYDARLIGGTILTLLKIRAREKTGRLNGFYLLEEQALGPNANRCALIFEGREYTYKQLYETVLKYGTWLKTKHNIKPKEIVAMDFMNSDKFILLWLGLWSIGAKPAFINYNLTGQPLVHCVRVSKTRLVLVDPEIQDKVTQEVQDELSGVQFQLFSPELEAEVMSTTGVREDDSVRYVDQGREMAILIYTSGTTGLPKGAMVSFNKTLVSNGLVPIWMHFKREDIFYTSMPLYHSSASILGFCNALATGATFSLGKKFSTKTFWNDCRATKATVIQYVGETCRYLLAAPPQIDPKTGENLDKKNDVRLAFGNGLRPDIWNRFKERFGIEAIAEFYAATEASGACWNYSKNDFSKGAIGRIGTFGYLIAGSTFTIVELDLETEQPYRDPKTGLCKPVPRGQPGEMLYALDAKDIRKSYQGYYDNATSTESKILRDVLKKGDAYYRSGDLISFDAEGRSYFNDRIGDTFRWKSENVSTNEVAEALGVHPSVHDANVYGVELPHHDGRAGCVALVLAQEPDDKIMSDLAEHVHRKLPKFAVPLFLRVTKNLAITGTNKQQKHVIRKEGVDPEVVCGAGDELYWLKNGTYRKFEKEDWEELRGGRVRL